MYFLRIPVEQRANIYAHALSFLVNVTGYIITNNFIFIWIEIASLSFIGFHTAKSPKFFDRNILNHFLTVMIYYLLAHVIGGNDILYSLLIFGFTYFYFILKDNGFNKSSQLWMYIQALLIDTTFVSFPFQEKIIATVVAYIEAQLILNLTFAFFSNNEQHEAERKYIDIFKINLRDWIDFHKESVKLAIRGAFTATILYSLCSGFHDLKPNWAVVTAVSCLQRNDKDGSLRAIKGIAIGSLLGWPLVNGLISLLGHHALIATLLLWGFMIAALILSLEQIKSPNLNRQIVVTIFYLITTTCISIGMNAPSHTYVHLKVINSLIGIGVGFLALGIWEYTQKWSKKPLD